MKFRVASPTVRNQEQREEVCEKYIHSANFINHQVFMELLRCDFFNSQNRKIPLRPIPGSGNCATWWSVGSSA